MSFARKLRLVGLITAFWLLIAFYMWLNDVLFVASAPELTLSPRRLWLTFQTSMLGGLLGGLLGGSGIVFFLRDRTRHLPMAAVIALHTGLYLATIVVVAALVSALYYVSDTGAPLLEAGTLRAVWEFLAGPAFARVVILWTATAGLTSVLLEVNDKYGPGVFRDFLLGRYHRPKVEERFFMFLDLKGSTTIAERLGHVEYFHFLSACIDDCTDPILQREGRIHEYVGDQIVISWTAEEGAQDANSVRCFYDVERALQARADAYRRRFGLVPEFRAGVHFGPVTTGEIGIVKKEIVFSGDVLNTTARIEERCKVLGVDILVSGDAMARLGEELSAEPIEEIELRGKAVSVTLYRPA